MRLQTLKIKGFKSFADNTVINFNENITGIVGPNGCGKSNIVDAMRWVLGEQSSKELRSEKMSNVIFNGTKKRKQGGLASVSLTFENTKNLIPSEYNNITITRMLFRSGESEYRINDVPCRLKDITSLFLDTGIGSNSYAIIALGMVDDLLADRDNSRRKIFEQAAGISKYKIRKHQTLNKLKLTKADLDRVEDLLFEIEGNLKKLERQAKRAKKYFEIKEEYKNLSIELGVVELNEHKTNFKSIEKTLTEENDKSLKLQTEMNTLESAIQKAKKQNLEKEQYLSDNQKKLNKVVSRIRIRENDKKILNQKIGFIEQNKTTLSQTIQQTKQRLNELKLSIQQYENNLNAERQIDKAYSDQLQKAKEQLEQIRGKHASVKTELNEFVKNHQVGERQIFQFEKQIAVNASRLENLQRDIQRTDQNIEKRTSEISSTETELTAFQKENTTLLEDINKKETAEEQRQKDIEQTEKDITTLKDGLAKINRTLDAQRNEYNLTKSLVENLEGFPESIKFLSKHKTWKHNALLLSDIISCPEDCRIAIENYLGNYLNYYVVKNRAEAIEAIQLLSKAQRGKANFFLMDSIQKQATKSVETLPNTIKATDVITTDAPYQALLNHLIGDVLLTDLSINDVNAHEADSIILTKDGRFIQQKYALSGGSVGLFEGKKIGRKKNLESLGKKIDALDKDKKQSQKELDTLQKNLHTLRQKDERHTIRMMKRKQEGIQQNMATLNARMESFTLFMQDANQQKNKAQETIVNLTKENNNLGNQLNTARTEVKLLNEQISKMDASFKSVADELTEASSNYNQTNISTIRQQNKIKTLEQELSFRQQQNNEAQQKLVNDQNTLAQSDQEIQKVNDNLQRIGDELTRLYDERSDQQAYLSHAEQQFFDARGQVNEMEDKLRNLNRSKNQLQLVITQLKDKFTEVKLKLSSVTERLRIEFSINANDLINATPSEELSKDELTERVEKLRKRLANYGEINPMAVEAFDEMKERYDFISGQKADLVEAQESLMATIQEIEDTATERFLEAFEEVRSNFKEVFRRLFTENDECDLILDNPVHPLDSAIKIIAKPKGKRPLTINQLSGGEKTLTATALLFSLYLLKPAPFCIFDEVDAPLDDANISKFNRIIQEFSKDSQFIIVTHNKQTMAAVDIIYGVSMVEQGISQVVPVDFRSLN